MKFRFIGDKKIAGYLKKLEDCAKDQLVHKNLTKHFGYTYSQVKCLATLIIIIHHKYIAQASLMRDHVYI